MQPTSARKLTVSILTFDDFDGLYFTIQALRMYHPEVADEIEFLVMDNNPASKQGEANERFMKWIVGQPVRYVKVTDCTGSVLKYRAFDLAQTPYVLGLDSHVLLAAGALRKLIDFFDAGRDEGNLLQGPLQYDDLRNLATHFDPVWRGLMWGIWGSDDRGQHIDGEPFEIPAQGMGLFACRKDAWVGFNPLFSGFGGEECYIHEKFRQAGRKTLCLPFLRWVHRFERPAGPPYRCATEDRVRNYLLGHHELGLSPSPMLAHFKDALPVQRMCELQLETAPLSDEDWHTERTTLPAWIEAEGSRSLTLASFKPGGKAVPMR